MMNIKTFFLLAIITLLSACSGTKPTDIGVANGVLKACPTSPNCISTQAAETDKQHYMSPLPFNGTMAETKAKIVKIIEGMERTTITDNTGAYIHSEFMTKTMKYVDDVEFYFDETNRLVHFRSASRKGYSDMGLNRKRMEAIVAAYQQ